MNRVLVVSKSNFGFKTAEQEKEFEQRVSAVAKTMGIPYLIIPYGFMVEVVSEHRRESTGPLEPIEG